jgi:hypothetical protein
LTASVAGPLLPARREVTIRACDQKRAPPDYQGEDNNYVRLSRKLSMARNDDTASTTAQHH